MKSKNPELISPAGDWCALNTALDAGADAVYFGIKNINMRHWAGNFDILEIKKIMDLVKSKNKKGYLALNTIIFEKEIKKVKTILDKAKKAGVDAVTLWDMAVLKHAKSIDLNVHLSTQASVANFSALKYYSEQGVKRVVLARECGLGDIKSITAKIKKEKLKCEIEVFIHGAQCVSISGRCFMSYYSFGKSANRGKCIQPCRHEFLIKDTGEKSHEYIMGKDYILSPKDLCTIDFFEKIMNSGAAAFKIEGRMRSPEYVKEVTSVYREAIDSFSTQGLSKSLKNKLKKRLSSVYNRGFSNGFYFKTAADTGSKEGKIPYDKIFIGNVISFYSKINVAGISVINKGIKKGDEILIYGKTTPPRTFVVKQMHKQHTSVEKAEKGEKIGIKLPFRVRPKDKVFIIT